jgi:hypothetical protein
MAVKQKGRGFVLVILVLLLVAVTAAVVIAKRRIEIEGFRGWGQFLGNVFKQADKSKKGELKPQSNCKSNKPKCTTCMFWDQSCNENCDNC